MKITIDLSDNELDLIVLVLDDALNTSNFDEEELLQNIIKKLNQAVKEGEK